MFPHAQPLQNRVTPLGDLVAIPQRGTLMGNRGCLHDEHGTIRHRWRSRRWISCVLNYKRNRVPLRTPGRYTPLFFEDEVSALAAGHRPCAQCRHEDYRAFIAAVERAKALNPGSLNAEAFDTLAHSDRVLPLENRRSLSSSDVSKLPVGTMISKDGRTFLISTSGAIRHGWSDKKQLSSFLGVKQLTPDVFVAALRGGYVVRKSS